MRRLIIQTIYLSFLVFFYTFPLVRLFCTIKSVFAHLSLSWSNNGWVALSFLCLFVRSSCYGNTRPNLRFFQYIQALKPHINPVPLNSKQYQIILTWCYYKSTSTALYCPSTTKYNPVLLLTDPVPPSTNQYRLLLTQYHHISYSNIRLSFVDLRWTQLYVSLVVSNLEIF